MSRLNYLTSPQCSPDAVVHLLKETGSTHLMHDHKYRDLAAHAETQGDKAIQLIPLVSDWQQVPNERDPSPLLPRILSPAEESDTLAIVFHSSGSTGMPKPVYQKHSVWTAALPRHPGPASFSTTPLYHGGLSDLLRGFMSDSCTHLFTGNAPITASNVLASLRASQPAPAYFLAVPYILKLLAENRDTREYLSHFEMISVGGAPMSEELGDELVQRHGWNLVSRLGSSECGCKTHSEISKKK